ncbi:MAG: DeoR/GlpR family DNA-binding transcription regulator [Jatrophihabitans sp.]|uniref:DeoR/GlpR family DNA-binding transcription regulator n=1 Tax=Jatrophihabitans sp. TaxID=1932789 RepID=UPI003F7F9AFB
MLARQRQDLILEQIRRSGSVRVSEMTALLGVSDMTIRRDLERLHADGALKKVRGGAVMEHSGRVAEEPSFALKSTIAQDAKQAIAAHAASLVEPGTAIAVSAGTTTWAMAPHLARVPSLTVVTNSITVAETIAAVGDPTQQTVILTGGVRTPSAALVGPVADLTIRSLHVDQLFIGTYGLDPASGFTSPNLAEAETNRALMAQAGKVIVLADASKWRTVGLASWGNIEDADLLVSDDDLGEDALVQLENAGPKVVLVSPERS